MIYLIVKETPEFEEYKTICKIGYSKNPKQRLSTLQTGNEFRLHLNGVVEGNKLKETEIHTLFKNYKIFGEWFNYNKEIQNYFDSNSINKNEVIEINNIRILNKTLISLQNSKEEVSKINCERLFKQGKISKIGLDKNQYYTSNIK